MGDVIGGLLQPLGLHFKYPSHITEQDVPNFLSAYIDPLKGYPDDVLNGARLAILKTRTSRVFPTVAECLEACVAVQAELAEPDLSREAKDRHPEWSPEAVANASRLLAQYEWRAKALEQGWILSLWDFLREKARFPNRYEADKIATKHREQVKRTNAFLADQKARNIPISPDVKRLYAMRAQRLQKLSDIVLKAA